MPKGVFALIIGPTAVGKNTVLEAVLKRLPSSIHVLSTTCRDPRPGERDGADYHFLSCKAFQERAAAGDFFEHAQYSKHWYGTSRSGLERALDASSLAIKIVEIQGAGIIKAKMPEAVTIFIKPGDFADLPRRWKLRAEEKGAAVDPDDLERRLATARDEITAAETCDHVVTNWDGSLWGCIEETLDILKTRARLT
jgi:guanylate kinase